MRHDAAFRVHFVASRLKQRLRAGHEPCNTCIIIIMWLRSWCHAGIGHIPVRLEVLITWSRPNSDLQRVGSGLLKNHKNSLFVWKFHSTFANWYGLFKRTIKVTTFSDVVWMDSLSLCRFFRVLQGWLREQGNDMWFCGEKGHFENMWGRPEDGGLICVIK